VGLDREFVEVAFSGKKRDEQVQPLWQVLTTHTARHTGAALLVLGSEGDQTLKEIALGHVSASVYGYDTLERYGPRLLEAWQVGLGEWTAPSSGS
jgi:integrase